MKQPHPDFRQLARATALMLCLTHANGVQAETGAAEMHVVAMPLVDVLAWFSQESGLAVSGPDGLTGRVTDVRLTAQTDAFTGWLTQEFGLDHYRLGRTLHLTHGSESLRQMVPLGGVPLAELTAGVAALDAQSAVPLMAAGQEGSAVLIAGPPPFVALVTAVLDDLKAAQAMRTRIVVNRGGTLTIDDLNTRRVIVQTPAPTATATQVEN